MGAYGWERDEWWTTPLKPFGRLDRWLIVRERMTCLWCVCPPVDQQVSGDKSGEVFWTGAEALAAFAKGGTP